MDTVGAGSSTRPLQRTSSNAPTDFASDPRVSFNKVTEKWEYEDDDGNEMEWDALKNAWVPIIDEELIKQQQAGYSVAGVDEDTPVAPVLARTNKKRKIIDYTGAGGPNATEEEEPPKKRGKKGKPGDPSTSTATTSKPPVSKNTAVYITNLPRDATTEEVAARFSKCGVIMEDDDGSPKIKMYADPNGEFSGEALVVYFMEGSVTLALNILDEAEFRIGDPSSVMRVKKGEFGHKQAVNGEPVQRRVVDKKKATHRITKMKTYKIAEWGFDDGFGPMEDPVEKEELTAKSRVAVLKHMFTPQELEQDPALLLELKEDVREEAETLGDVTNVVLYDLEPEGIMTVKFRDPISAQACVLKMNGRWFSGRQVEAYLFTGKQRFNRTVGGGNAAAGDDDEGETEKKRLEEFEKWLMDEGEK